MKRSPMIISMIKKWASENDIYIPGKGPIEESIVHAWIEWYDEQKPIVYEDSISGDKRKIVVFCTKCANIHRMFVEPGIRSYGDKILEPMCEGKYWNTKPYLYIDILPISKKELEVINGKTNDGT